ncbi:MAG: globin domain-containing protein [Planctomycetota bacterium]|nr:globin domain-containing protein [Planctomycetota bacterium]
MTQADWRQVRASLAELEPCGPALVAMVVRRLGDTTPEVRAMLPADTSALHARWFATLRQVVEHADRFGKVAGPLADLGRRAHRAGARAGHYRAGRDELLRAMAELSGDSWSLPVERAWAELLDAAIGAMLSGSVPRARAA